MTDVLLRLDYLERDEHGRLAATSAGRMLRRIYGDRDLLVAESLRRGLWNSLDPAGLAAMACALVFEPRRDESETVERYLPRGAFPAALEATQLLWSDLDDLERDSKLPGIEPDRRPDCAWRCTSGPGAAGSPMC